VGDGENKCVKNPKGIISGTLRQYWCVALCGEDVKISTYLYLGFLCIFRLSWSDFLVVAYPVRVVLHVSLSLCAVFLALSLDGSLAITASHYVLALYLLVSLELMW